MKKCYVVPVVDFAKVRKSQTIPDQSMSIQEIVKRFVRGIPVDIVRREGVYVDQHDHDLEKLSRMDFGQKAEYAQALADRANRLQADLKEQKASYDERKANEAKAAADKAQEAKKAERSEAGIVVP